MAAEIDIHDENLIIYLEESNDYLSDIETDLLALEDMGENVDETLINKVFRAAHTIKGGAGFFNLLKIKKLGHKAENILDLIRAKKLVPTSEIINILLIAFDRLRDLLNNVETSNDADITEMVDSLTALLQAEIEEKVEKKLVNEVVPIKDGNGKVVMSISAYDYNKTIKSESFIYLIYIDLIHDIQFKGKNPLDLHRNMLGTGSLEESVIDFSNVGTLDDEDAKNIPMYILFSTKIKPRKISKLFEVDEDRVCIIHDPTNIKEVVTEAPPKEEPVVEELPKVEPPKEEIVEPKDDYSEPKVTDIEAKAMGKTQQSTSLRVKVELLERLMILAGELVLSRNELNEAINKNDKKTLQSSGQRISQVTSEIQEAIMMTRLQAIGSVFNKFPRLVRDMSQKLDKKLELKITGEEVELDKTIIEGLNDPLVHMIRNSVDHGIEKKADRARTGKPQTGLIELKAFHEAGQVIIEISDDGNGIDSTRLIKKAISNGLITAEDAANMSHKDKMNLIFHPGLSTAEKVTDVSGRGVGMDVVKSKLDELGGVIEITSKVGVGSVFRIKLPLTLAIIPSLLVTSDNERYAIPQINIDELINIQAKDKANRIEKLGWVDVLDLRGDLIPLVKLDTALGIPSKYTDPETKEVHDDRRDNLADRRKVEKGTEQEDLKPLESAEYREKKDRRINHQNDINVVIVSAGIYKYGLVVEQLDENLEIVVKPLGRHISNCAEYAGATIMGDGKVALIVDVAGIAQASDVQSITKTKHSSHQDTIDSDDVRSEIQSYLTFRSSESENCAIPMQIVTRVEHIGSDRLEYVGGKRIMQYRGKSLPIVALHDVNKDIELKEDLELSVIVTNIYDREIGLLAVRPIDSLNLDIEIDKETLKQTGVLGSAIVGDKTTLIVNIFELIETVLEDLAVHHKVEANIETGDDTPLVLLAEDSSFFRHQINDFLIQAGYRTIEAEDGQIAWDKLQESEEVPAIVVTDIEMPNMDGYGFSRKIRGDDRFKHIPIIAVTSLAGDDNEAKGRDAGITEYHVKLEKDSLLKSLKNIIKGSTVK